MQVYAANRPLMTMIQLKQICVTVMVITAMAGAVSAEKPRIGTVDMQEIFRKYYRTNEAQERFNMEYANIQKVVNERIDVSGELNLMMKKLKSEILSGELTGELKNKKVLEYKILSQKHKSVINEMEQFQDEEKSKVVKLKKARMIGILREIRQKVSEFSEREGYDFVFDKSGKNTNQVSFFIYLKDAEDITSAVLKELNQLAPDASVK